MEGDTEHHIADRLVDEIKFAIEEDVWEAKAKVLAELVEHHIEEEEEEMLPQVRKAIELEERERIGEEYLRLRASFGAADEDSILSQIAS
jgi:hemerythrin-like domain-containing protein